MLYASEAEEETMRRPNDCRHCGLTQRTPLSFEAETVSETLRSAERSSLGDPPFGESRILRFGDHGGHDLRAESHVRLQASSTWYLRGGDSLP